MKNLFLFTLLLFPLIFSRPANAQDSPLAVGSNVGLDFPFAHSNRMDPGISVDAFARLDPYEIRFHYAYLKTHYYSVVAGMKYFFSQSTMRPFLEAAIGPAIVDTPSEGLGFGVSPVASLGVELGVNKNFSLNVVSRYSAYLYFGDTKSGDLEANHSLGLLGGMTLWF